MNLAFGTLRQMAALLHGPSNELQTCPRKTGSEEKDSNMLRVLHPVAIMICYDKSKQLAEAHEYYCSYFTTGETRQRAVKEQAQVHKASQGPKQE